MPDDSRTTPRSASGSTKPPPRPREATWAACLIMAGSVFVVLTSFERVAGLGSLEARRGVEEFLAEPPGQGLGLSVEATLDIIRVMSMVAGGTAAATAILGYQVLQRSRSARLTLAILAVPLFIGGLAAGGFMASLVAAAVVWLYLQPARDWFDGIARPTAPRAVAAAQPGPRPVVGFGQGPTAASSSGSPGTGPVPAHASAPDTATKRPASVVWACALTWGVCGLAIVLLSMVVLVLATVPEVFFDELRAQDPDFAGSGLSDGEIASASIVTSSLLIVWCIASITFAVFAFQRARWARIALLASVSGSVVLCLVGALASAILVLPLTLAVVTTALLMRPATVSWFRAVP